MKTPEEIKKSLRRHAGMGKLLCQGCAYRDTTKDDMSVRCYKALFIDVIAYIKQLEGDLAEERELNESLRDKNKRLAAQRDAACLKNRCIETMHMPEEE